MSKREITLHNIHACPLTQQLRIREIRNEPSIRASMYAEHEISETEHRLWLDCLSGDPRQLVFIVMEGDIGPVGAVSLSGWDKENCKTDWAFYLSETARGGLGAMLEFHFLEFAFGTLGLKKMNCEVLETNDAVVRLHQKFGFQIEGCRRDNAFRFGKRIGAILLGLTENEWMQTRSCVQADYLGLFEKISVTIADLENGRAVL